jgi:mRNA interferase HigB
MLVVGYKKLTDFAKKHADAAPALEAWYKKTCEAQWRSLIDIKNMFNSVDYVGNKRYVFNIKGNKYRIVVLIEMAEQTAQVRFVGTHSEYDDIDCKSI